MVRRTASRMYLAAFSSTLVLFALTCSANAGIVYSATTPRFFDPNDIGPMWGNAGFFSGGVAGRTLYDDVPVHVGNYLAPTVNVTQVSFDISRRANQPGMTVTAVWAPMLLDAAQNGGASDGPNDDPGAPIVFGSVNLGPSGSTHSRQTVTFGNGSTVLFNTGLLNNVQAPGFGLFTIGLQFSDTTSNQGWTIGTADLDDNSDVVWNYGSALNIQEFTYPVDVNLNPIIGTHMMVVQGELLPEPGSVAALLIGSVFMLARRARD